MSTSAVSVVLFVGVVATSTIYVVAFITAAVGGIVAMSVLFGSFVLFADVLLVTIFALVLGFLEP